MIKVGAVVYEVGSNVRGVIVDIEDDADHPYGVLFDDVDEDNGVWWCNDEMIFVDKQKQ